jgi:hypothetical protein
VSNPDPIDDPDDQKPNPGTISLTSPAVLTLYGVIGLVAGWVIRPLSLRMGWVEPRVSWLVIGLVFFLALIVGVSAWLTTRTLRHDRLALTPERAVNRLVMGKACARAGALLLGGFGGYAIAQLGLADPASGPRMLRSLLAACGSAAVMTTALLLERACRVPRGDE